MRFGQSQALVVNTISMTICVTRRRGSQVFDVSSVCLLLYNDTLHPAMTSLSPQAAHLASVIVSL